MMQVFSSSQSTKSAGMSLLTSDILAKIANHLTAPRDRAAFVVALRADSTLLKYDAERLTFGQQLSSRAARRDLALSDSSNLIHSQLLGAADIARVALHRGLREAAGPAFGEVWHPKKSLAAIPRAVVRSRQMQQSLPTMLLFIRAAEAAPRSESSIALSYFIRNLKIRSQDAASVIVPSLLKASHGAPQVLQELVEAVPALAKTQRRATLLDVIDAANAHPYVLSRAKVQAGRLSARAKRAVLDACTQAETR